MHREDGGECDSGTAPDDGIAPAKSEKAIAAEVVVVPVRGRWRSTASLRRGLSLLSNNDLARDLVIGLILVLAGFATAFWLEHSIADQQQALEAQRSAQQIEIEESRQRSQEVLENTRFVREVALNPDAAAQPFNGLSLGGAQLGSLNLACRGPRYCADFRKADLTAADLTFADLTGANMMMADLVGADLGNARLPDAVLITTNMRRAHMSFVNFAGANLFGADLTGANLLGAHFAGADLTGANVNGADLTGAEFLESANLTNICFNGETKWPWGFQPPRQSGLGCPD